MKHKKDISDLIKENQHKLNERPSPRAWKRLESKLDNQRSRHQTSVYKQFAMVAAVIALVAVASLITMTIGNQESSKMAQASPTSSFGLPVQELETVYTDANEDLHKVVEFQRSLKRIYASNPNPIAEGTQHNKVIAAKEISKPNNTYTQPKLDDSALALNEPKPAAKPSKNNSVRKEMAKELKKEELTKNSKIENVTESATDAIMADISVEEEMADEPAVIASAESIEYKDEPATYGAIMKASPPAASMAKVKKKESSEWFLGSWKYDDNLNRTEKIRIFKVGEKVQLIVQNDGNKNFVFDLISFKNNRATFGDIDNNNQGYNIRIENDKYVIYKNDQDYGLLIEKLK